MTTAKDPATAKDPTDRTPRGDLVFHLAEAAHWEEAQESGEYLWSTLGRTIADEGFMHASEGHQWEITLGRYYSTYLAEGGHLVLLTIDPKLLTAPLVHEVGNPLTGERFPHLYGCLNTDAVIEVRDITTIHDPNTRNDPNTHVGPVA